MATRKEAIANGDKTYTGKPCKHGHTLKYTIACSCVECEKEYQKEYQKEYRKNNKEKLQAYAKAIRTNIKAIQDASND